MTGQVDRVDRAQSLLEMNRPEQAVPLLAGHLAECPQDWRGLCVLSWALHDLGQDEAALAAARAAAAADPTDEWSRQLMASALVGLGRLEEAEASARDAVQVADGLADARRYLAEVLLLRRRPRDAWDQVQTALQLEPDDPDVHRVAGDVARVAGWRLTATEAYGRALALAPGDDVALHGLGLLEVHRGRLATASGTFTGAARLAPTVSRHSEGVVIAGWLLLARAGLVLVACAFGLGLGVTSEEDGTSSSVSPAVLLMVTVLGVAALALIAAVTIGRLTAVVRSVLWRRVLRTPWGAVAGIGIVVAVGAGVATPLTGRPGDSATVMLVASGVSFLVGRTAGERRLDGRSRVMAWTARMTEWNDPQFDPPLGSAECRGPLWWQRVRARSGRRL